MKPKQKHRSSTKVSLAYMGLLRQPISVEQTQLNWLMWKKQTL